jgi:L-threonylcarbamoyladenylate synthase
MKTRIKKVNYFSLRQAKRILFSDGVVAIPTETVYGLAANCFSDIGVQQIFKVKNREQDNPLIVHIYPGYDITNLVAEVNDTAKALMNAFWPGPLTLVFKSKNNVSKFVSRNLGTLAVRMPSHPDTIKILRYCKVPLSAPSANTSGRPSPTDAKSVFEDLKGKIKLILNGGKSQIGIECTVVDVTTPNPIILRPGVITEEDIEKVVSVNKNESEANFNRSPGTKYKHYAPSVMMIVSEFDSKVNLSNLYDNNKKEGKKPVIMCLKDEIKSYGKRKTYNLGKTTDDLIKNFYSALRFCEKHYDLILMKGLKRIGKQASIMNRIEMACGGNMV